jgi:glycosyltransferase involved in cell wall biosynthesis
MVKGKDLKYIQFIGTQRSGSNLLRVMLNQLPEISAPHPPHILKTFFPLLPYYGDLREPGNFLALVSDVCEWVNKNPVPWEDIILEPTEIVRQCRENTLMELFARVYEQKAVHDKAVYWCCKSMESVYHLNEIEDAGLNPFYIYIYRDGRDVALSFKKAIVGPKHIYHLAKKWKEEQELSLDLLDRISNDRFIEIRYEELILQPHTVMRLICEKLGLSFSEDIFNYYKSHESVVTASSGEMWQNVAKPIIATNFDKYKKELSELELKIFEWTAGEVLKKLGYSTSFSQKAEPQFSSSEIDQFNSENELLRKKSLQQGDPEDLKRRAPQEQLLTKIKNRVVQYG